MFLQIEGDMFTATNETTIVCKWFVNSCSVICFIKCGDNVRIDMEILKLMFWVLVLCRSEWGRRHAQNPNYRNSRQWPTYIINSVDKTKLFCNTLHWKCHSFLETKPLSELITLASGTNCVLSFASEACYSYSLPLLLKRIYQ